MGGRDWRTDGGKGLVEEDWNGRDEWRKKILGGRDSRTDGGKGASGRRLEWQRRMEKEDIISVQWAQEDVETSYSLVNNNKWLSLLYTLRYII